MKTQFFAYFLLCSLSACAQKQQRETETPTPKVVDSTYVIGDYQFNPTKKTVAVLQEYPMGIVGSAMGYFVDKQIKYDSTVLVVLGNKLLFKEHFPKDVDFSTLQYIGERNYGVGLFRDKQFIYAYSNNFLKYQGASKKVDISAYKRLNDYVYESQNGDLYFLKTADDLQLVKIEGLPNLDKHTLTHLQGQYFVDKNGLYALGVRYFGHMYSEKFSQTPINILVESANGKTIKPVVTRNYIVYGNSVYAKGHAIDKLKLDVNKMMELKWGIQNIYFITDGTNLYENRHSSYREAEWNKDNHYANDFFKSGINLVKIFSSDLKFLQGNDKNTLYFNNIKRGKTVYTEKSGLLIKTDQGYYFANMGRADTKPEKIDKVVIYNEKTKQNEDFEDSEFLNIEERIFAYKGNIFFNNIAIKEVNEAKNLQFFTQNGIKTNFVTSGNMLIAFGNIGGYQTEISNGEEKVVFEKWIKRDIDIAKLRAINKNLLVDDANFYDCSNGGLQIIPFNKLGLPVKLFLPTAPIQYDF